MIMDGARFAEYPNETEFGAKMPATGFMNGEAGGRQ
jgi:hypothetical protein